MPPFRSRQRFSAYRGTLEDYLAVLATAGVRVVETEMRGVDRADGSVAGYVVQPVLPQEHLAPATLRRSDPGDGHPLVEAVAGTVAATVSPRVGLDAQLANWTWDGSSLTYIDVSTPLIWSADGESRLDMELLAMAYPASLRWPLRRFVAPGILDTYRDLRKVYLDLTGNLLKERLDPWLAPLPRPDQPAPRGAARRGGGAGLLPLRQAPLGRPARAPQARPRLASRVRRRPYPFLLPGRIER